MTKVAVQFESLGREYGDGLQHPDPARRTLIVGCDETERTSLQVDRSTVYGVRHENF